MFELKLTEEQLKNLQVFLQRVKLIGSEVPAFVDIIQAINNSKAEEGE